MKKFFFQTGIISLILVFVIAVMSCGTTAMGVYSTALQTVESDQLCNLRIHLEMGITGFNGKAVSWGISRESKHTEIAIPAGSHTMRFEYYYESEYVRQQAGNFAFSYDFLAGHNYDIRAAMSGRLVVVFITDKTDRSLSATIPMRG